MRATANITESDLLERVLYRDHLLIVLNKPSGIAVHPGPGPMYKQGPNLESMFGALTFGSPDTPALIHRLDRDTSGCLVLGRNRKALRKGGEMFAEGRAEKTYLAVCVGAPEKPSGRIMTKLIKVNDIKAGWEMQVVPLDSKDGQTSITDYQVLATSLKGDKTYSLIAFFPKTGRTHQIRVHADHIGCPLQGDPRYGKLSPDDRSVPFCLHAWRIVMPFYGNKPPVAVEAPLPPAFIKTLDHHKIDMTCLRDVDQNT